ncbi:hypothetical protein CDL15_Pgr014183 [Punica granatum]|uniref:Uncharacterized protein n=1 Tax=Punica granatum TaxID=22663 RepID=A0A218XJV1_PUNGR|nr:hypothetical protein CDL15_Pgr014183 [Punica granatum]
MKRVGESSPKRAKELSSGLVGALSASFYLDSSGNCGRNTKGRSPGSISKTGLHGERTLRADGWVMV